MAPQWSLIVKLPLPSVTRPATAPPGASRPALRNYPAPGAPANPGAVAKVSKTTNKNQSALPRPTPRLASLASGPSTNPVAAASSAKASAAPKTAAAPAKIIARSSAKASTAPKASAAPAKAADKILAPSTQTRPALPEPSTELAPQSTLPDPSIAHRVAKISTYFTQSQFALALAISKSKPRELSIREYHQQLHRHIKNGTSIPNDELRYIDTPEFWREQYTKIHSEKKLLEAKINRLEESQRQLRERVEEGNHSLEEEFQESVASDLVAGSGSKKRPAGDDELESLFWREQNREQSSAAENILLTLSSYVLQIKRQHNILCIACEQSNTGADIDDLAQKTLQILALLGRALSDCCPPLHITKTNEENSQALVLFQQVVDQVGLSFLACFKALQELCRLILGRTKKPEIVYQMVMLFRNSLSLLHFLSEKQAEHEAFQGHRSLRQKRARKGMGEYAVNEYLTKMILSILHGMEWKTHQPGHSELLEGILFCILEHVGHLVSEATFGEHVAISDNPSNITKTDVPRINESSKIEARYMVQILHAALGGSSRKELVANVLATGKTNINAPPRNTRSRALGVLGGGLLTKAKLLLQSTLMKSAVGGSTIETLRLPTPPAEETILQIEKEGNIEEYGSDWLIKTVWALIGWDLID